MTHGLIGVDAGIYSRPKAAASTAAGQRDASTFVILQLTLAARSAASQAAKANADLVGVQAWASVVRMAHAAHRRWGRLPTVSKKVKTTLATAGDALEQIILTVHERFLQQAFAASPGRDHLRVCAHGAKVLMALRQALPVDEAAAPARDVATERLDYWVAFADPQFRTARFLGQWEGITHFSLSSAERRAVADQVDEHASAASGFVHACIEQVRVTVAANHFADGGPDVNGDDHHSRQRLHRGTCRLMRLRRLTIHLPAGDAANQTLDAVMDEWRRRLAAPPAESVA